jgi:hypothetical protein
MNDDHAGAVCGGTVLLSSQLTPWWIRFDRHGKKPPSIQRPRISKVAESRPITRTLLLDATGHPPAWNSEEEIEELKRNLKNLGSSSPITVTMSPKSSCPRKAEQDCDD